MRPIVDFQRLLLGHEAVTDGDPFAERLQRAVADANVGIAGKADVAVLVRQALLRRPSADEFATLRVPRGNSWPDQQLWREFGCDVFAADVNHFQVSAKTWQPAWLDVGAGSAVLEAFREVPRKEDRRVPVDPMVEALTRYPSYSCAGQREAVRAVFFAPRGSTVLVNLPTGVGKTLAFQITALHGARDCGLTLVVVPTVALARDQSARFAALASSGSPLSYAYFGGLDKASKGDLRRAISQGTQAVVFTSPEAAFGALRGPLFEAASRGQLRYFAVDEAHIVAQWGQQFRPEFQALAGLRDALLAVSPAHAQFRTLLLTATLTQETLNTLRHVFGTTLFQVVSEPMLRPEPAFMISSADNEEERTTRVLEALKFLPRPTLLYTTERNDAQRLFDLARKVGFLRSRIVRGGDLDGISGHEILDGWKRGSIDLIVATSAFGLGVDQADVRSVIHACLPETMDRYYQELGRAGRDGSACISLLVSAPRDVDTANRIGRERLLSTSNAFERWTQMWAGRRHFGDNLYVLSLDTLSPGVDQTSEQQISWNLRALILMARASLLRFAAHCPTSPEANAGESDDSFERRRAEELRRFYREVVVQVIDPRHSDQAHWMDAVQATRNALRSVDQSELTDVLELRDLRRPLNEIFRKIYTLTDPISEPPVLRGSCPVHRSRGSDQYTFVEPEVLTLDTVEDHLAEPLRSFACRYADASGRCWVTFERPKQGRDRSRWTEELRELLRRFASCGIVEFALPDVGVLPLDWQQIAAYAPSGFVARADLECGDTPHSRPMPLRRFSLLFDDGAVGVAKIMQICRPLHLIVIPNTTVDPVYPHRVVAETRRHARWSDLVTEFVA